MTSDKGQAVAVACFDSAQQPVAVAVAVAVAAAAAGRLTMTDAVEKLAGETVITM